MTVTSAWPMVKLGEVLKGSEEWINIYPDELYTQVTVRMWGKGVVQRDIVKGVEIAGSKRWVVRYNQLILSRIDARHGAIGLVPKTLDGAVVTTDFPAFNFDQNRLLPEYLNWLCKTASFVSLCVAASEGTTNRVRLQEAKFLALEILLPQIEEQRRIVGRIEELAGKIEEASRLRRQTLMEAKLFLPSVTSAAFTTIRSTSKLVTVEDVAKSVTDGDHQPPPKSETGIPFIFISNVISGRINFEGCNSVPVDYFNGLSKTRIPEKGDVLYTAVGSYGIPCLVETSNPFCFQRHIAIIKPNHDLILSKYLVYALSSTSVLEQATSYATGSAQKTVPLRGIRNLTFALPSLEAQRQIVEYLDMLNVKLEGLKQLQAATEKELEALLPSVLDRAFKGKL